MMHGLRAESDPLLKQTQVNAPDTLQSKQGTRFVLFLFFRKSDSPFSGWYKVAFSGQGSAAVKCQKQTCMMLK